MNTKSEIRITLNPELKARHDKWNRAEAMLLNNEDAFKKPPFFIDLPNESPASANDRKRYFVTGFINPADELVTTPGDVLYKNGKKLTFKNESSLLSTFAKNVMLGDNEISFEDYLGQFTLPGLRAFGTTYTVIDKPPIIPQSRAQERAEGMPYLTNIRPQDVIDYRYVNGELSWFAYKSSLTRPWNDPSIEDEPPSIPIMCVWTKDKFIMVEKDGKVIAENPESPGMGSFVHNLGIVPVVIYGAYMPRPSDIVGQCAFDKTSNMLIMFNNQLHVAVGENFKHGNSMLLMHEESISATNMETDKTGASKMKRQAQGNVLSWSGSNKPEYLTKELNIENALKLALFYWTKAIENERDLKSLANKGMDGEQVQESGFAKMIDREPLEANLVGLAIDGERWSKKVFGVVAKYLAVENDASLEFNKQFDLRSAKQAFDDISVAIKINLGRWTSTGIKELYKGAMNKFISKPETLEMTYQEIEDNAEDIALEEKEKETLRREMETSFPNIRGSNGEQGEGK